MKSDKSTPAGQGSKAKGKAKEAQPALPAELLQREPPSPAGGGPGQRYAVGERAEGVPAEGGLPEAYGTGRLLLTARDPYWLFAHWDLTREQLQAQNAASADGHMVLRIYKDGFVGDPFQEIHLHPDARNWFVNVGLPEAKFLGELGYYGRERRWVSLSKSAATLTPTDKMSEDTSVWFETLPGDLGFDHLVDLVRSAVRDNVPLMEAIQQLREAGVAGLPDREGSMAPQWSDDQRRALAEIISRDAARRVWMGSLEITELVRRQFHQQLFSAAASMFSLPSSWSAGVSSFSSVSSPFGRGERAKGFWFNVNAELIIYGATEADATVTIGGRKIQLRPDGTFSFRFALPDGQYDLPAEATSADGDDTRRAALQFKRATEYRGEVGRHPQDPQLKPPLAANVS